MRIAWEWTLGQTFTGLRKYSCVLCGNFLIFVSYCQVRKLSNHVCPHQHLTFPPTELPYFALTLKKSLHFFLQRAFTVFSIRQKLLWKLNSTLFSWTALFICIREKFLSTRDHQNPYIFVSMYLS